MNSFITIEINSLLTEWVRGHPITGRDSLDQKLVTMIVSLVATYIIVANNKITQMLYYIYERFFGEEDPMQLNKDKNVVHVKITSTGVLYTAFVRYVKNLKHAELVRQDHVEEDESIRIEPVNDSLRPWVLIDGGATLPNDAKDPKINGSVITWQKHVIFEDRELTVVNVFYGTYHLIHFFIKKRRGDKREDLKNLAERFVDAAFKYYNETNVKTKEISLYEIRDGEWTKTLTLSPKSMKTIVGHGVKFISEDINTFQTELRALYKSLDVPYKRGYLLYGPPGTGKTSIVKGIASSLGRSIYKVTFTEDNLGDEDYVKLLSQTSMESLILMDDIPPMLLKEGGFITKTTTDSSTNSNSEQLNETVNRPRILRVSYGTLLDALDGVNANNGRITFITTNHPDKMGSAILRPGRLDVKCKLGFTKNDEIVEYFKLFYGHFRISEEKIETCANDFIRSIRGVPGGDKITFASLQQYLVKYLKDIETAVSKESLQHFFKDQTFEEYV